MCERDEQNLDTLVGDGRVVDGQLADVVGRRRQLATQLDYVRIGGRMQADGIEFPPGDTLAQMHLTPRGPFAAVVVHSVLRGVHLGETVELASVVGQNGFTLRVEQHGGESILTVAITGHLLVTLRFAISVGLFTNFHIRFV